MASLAPPKAVLFDVGGVCVQSPLGAILSYERAHGIPPGYINATIGATSSNGSWQCLERGDIPLDDAFFARFQSELQDPWRWDAHWRRTLADRRQNPQSREAEAGGAETTPAMPQIDAKELFWTMMRAARRPDPDMWPALLALRASGAVAVVAALSNTVAFPDGVRDERGELFQSGLRPESDGVAAQNNKPSDGDRGRAETGRTTRFFERGGRVLELDGLDGGGRDGGDVRRAFDLFVSSAHVGLRKPERRIYQFALDQIRRYGREKCGVDIEPADVLFLDDIGANLKVAREMGLRTIRVVLGRVHEAVAELEGAVGVPLALGGRRARI